MYRTERFSYMILLLGLLLTSLEAQVTIYENPKHIHKLKEVVYYIYNTEFAPATLLIDSLQEAWPSHPAPDFLRALLMYWDEELISSESENFETFVELLHISVKKAEDFWENTEKTEALLFEISARGLLAERFANEGKYFKSIQQAKFVYNLVLEADKLKDTNIDLYFVVGLYNYFREKYPEIYPVYKPFMFFFKSGDKVLGLQQIHLAATQGLLSKPEANTYLAYIYLRYEHLAKQSLKYLVTLHKTYPRNLFYTSKLAEAYQQSNTFAASDSLIVPLLQSSRPYYLLAGHYLQGNLEENYLKNLSKARYHYEKAVLWGQKFQYKGSAFRAQAHIGLGRIAEASAQKDQARDHYKEAIRSTEHSFIKDQAKHRLKALK